MFSRESGEATDTAHVHKGPRPFGIRGLGDGGPVSCRFPVISVRWFGHAEDPQSFRYRRVRPKGSSWELFYVRATDQIMYRDTGGVNPLTLRATHVLRTPGCADRRATARSVCQVIADIPDRSELRATSLQG